MIKKSESLLCIILSVTMFILLLNFAFFNGKAFAQKAGTCTLKCKDNSTHSCPAPCEVRDNVLYCNGGTGSTYYCCGE